MLPEHLQELLTASVDGELSPAERKIADRLLRTSDEARVFHDRLLQDAGSLRVLPKSRPEIDLAGAIVNAIIEEGITPTPLPTRRRRRTWNNSFSPNWLPMALAASVILVLGLGSYYYFHSSIRSVADRPVESHKVDEAPAPRHPKLPVEVAPHASEVLAKNDPETAPAPREIKPLIARAGPEVLPDPRLAGNDLIQATPLTVEGPMLEMVQQIRLPLILPLRDLDQAYPREKFREDLKKDEVVRLDLFTRDTAKATEMLTALLKNKGQHVLIDAMVPLQFKKKQPTEVLFFTENLTADELAQLLEQLGADDKKAEGKKAGDGVFDKFVLAPFLNGDLDKLARLLGLSAVQLKLPKPKSPVGIDIRRPLEENTASALAQNLPKAPNAANKQPEKVTLVLSFSPINQLPRESKEIKSFLEKRADRKPGAVPVLLVIRTMN